MMQEDVGEDTYNARITEDARPEGMVTFDPRHTIFLRGELRVPILDQIEIGAKRLRNKVIKAHDRYREAQYDPDDDDELQGVVDYLPDADSIVDIRRASDADLEERDVDMDSTLLPPSYRDIVVELDHDLDLDAVEDELQDEGHAALRQGDMLYGHDTWDTGGQPDYVFSDDPLYNLGGSIQDPQPPMDDGDTNTRLEVLTGYLDG